MSCRVKERCASPARQWKRFSVLESKNRKVRVGDIIQSATLKHIESNRVVFSYCGETVHLRIGE